MLLNVPVMRELTDKINWQLVLAMRSPYIQDNVSKWITGSLCFIYFLLLISPRSATYNISPTI